MKRKDDVEVILTDNQTLSEGDVLSLKLKAGQCFSRWAKGFKEVEDID